MIVQDITVIVVKNLKIPFSYRPIHKPYKMYFKDYNIQIPLIITEDKLIEVECNSNTTVLIKYKKRYYWCPHFEELYKTYKGEINLKQKNRGLFVTRTTMKFENKQPILIFDYRSIVYETRDIKQILIKDANN